VQRVLNELRNYFFLDLFFFWQQVIEGLSPADVQRVFNELRN
jgi:hypothetical protein